MHRKVAFIIGKKRLKRNVAFTISIYILVAFSIIAIFSPLLTPYDPYKITGTPLEKPSMGHILGTNDLGQDIFSRLIYGTGITLLVGFIGGGLAILIGTFVGIVSGYYGGIMDEIITRGIDLLMVIPMFPLLLVLASFLEVSMTRISILMGILGWTMFARVIRSHVLSLSEYNFIYGAKAMGASDSCIMIKHILPNILPLIIVKFVFAVQTYMIMGVGLGFLGLGDPTTISWGQMINRAYTNGGFALGMWWWLLPPGLIIAFLSIALSLGGYSLEDKINPRLRREIEIS